MPREPPMDAKGRSCRPRTRACGAARWGRAWIRGSEFARHPPAEPRSRVSCNLGPGMPAGCKPNAISASPHRLLSPSQHLGFPAQAPLCLLPAGAGLIQATALASWADHEVGDIPHVPQLTQGRSQVLPGGSAGSHRTSTSRRERDPIAALSLCDGLKPLSCRSLGARGRLP